MSELNKAQGLANAPLPSSPSTTEPVQDGVIAETVVFGMEGTTNSFSLDEENLGFRLAFEERNARGEIHGRRIAWKGYARSSAADIDAAVANARKLVDEDRVFALINFGGPEVIPTSQLADEKRVPLLFPHSALVSSDGRRYLFTSYPSYEGEARAMLRYLAEDRGLRRIAIVHDVNVYGALFLRLLQQHATDFAYTFVGNVGIDTRNPADLTRELKGLVESGADAVMMALYPAQAKSLMAAKAKSGWTGRMISVGPLTDEQYLSTPGGAAEGTIGFCYYPDPNCSAEPGMAAYRATMAKFHPGRPLNRYSLYGYLFGRLAIEGLERAGRALTRESFIDAMETIADWDSGGIMPNVTFSRTNHHAQRAGIICELNGGRFSPMSGWIEP